MGAHPPFGPWRRRGLNPIKPVYDPDRPDGRLSLTASAFNQLGQYTSSPGRRGYCYAELAVFFPSGGPNHRQYSWRLPTEGWPGLVGLGGCLGHCSGAAMLNLSRAGSTFAKHPDLMEFRTGSLMIFALTCPDLCVCVCVCVIFNASIRDGFCMAARWIEAKSQPAEVY